ncbi:hypothetical protein [Pseudomonas fluorescens]|uniref:hypothetical protein n=1 Tax=Pseudomonas fluorescens TaxID=294 RepID=UPI0012498DA4|nr:hypothetical protein [Pseudomonas fluorescens]CAG8868676.1 hypothetical protein PS861_02633 [Pseudomonas fluorescens]
MDFSRVSGMSCEGGRLSKCLSAVHPQQPKAVAHEDSQTTRSCRLPWQNRVKTAAQTVFRKAGHSPLKTYNRSVETQFSGKGSMKGLFLGAGASYECGMPLVWEFTNVLRTNVLKRLDSNLFDFRSDPSFRIRFEAILSDPDIHYEQIIGELEKIQLERGPSSEIASSILRQLIDCVQILLLEDQVLTTKLLSEKVKDYSGIKRLLARHSCLHVFSLNHDINFEEICKFYGVQCRDGFFEPAVERYLNIANFKSLTKEQLSEGDLNFFNPEEVGVNLIKLHGSLDMFAVEDKNLYLKCAPPAEAPIGGHVQEIRRIEDHSLELIQRLKIRSVGELDVTDKNGEIQFLRRSLLSGAHKFKGTFDQIAPIAFFEEFKNRMSAITELDVIGYGFGDHHINEVLQQWLNAPNVSINIYDPFCKATPIVLAGGADRVFIHNSGLTDYFQKFDSLKPSLLSSTRKKIFELARERLRQKRLSLWQANAKT